MTPAANTGSGAELAYAAAEINYHRVEDAVIAVRVFGQGPPLILVHGYPVHGYTWRKVLPALAEQFTCYVVDLPGLGDSAWSAETDFSFTAQARRLGLLPEWLKLSRYSLVAQDTGATVARLVAAAHPGRVDKLAVMNTEMPGHRPPWIPLYRHLAKLPGAGTAFGALMRSSRFLKSPMGLGQFYSDPGLFDDPTYVGPYIEPLLASPGRMAGALQYLRGIEWGVVDGMRQAHSKIKADTLFLWGEDDRTFPVGLAEGMCGQMRAHTTFVRIAGASLMPHEEKPEAVLQHLAPFLKSQR